MTKAYQAGYNANYFGGCDILACPYNVGTVNYDLWRKGWEDCEAEHYCN